MPSLIVVTTVTIAKTRESERLLIWKSAISIAKSNLLFGVGIGDVREELDKSLSENWPGKNG